MAVYIVKGINIDGETDNENGLTEREHFYLEAYIKNRLWEIPDEDEGERILADIISDDIEWGIESIDFEEALLGFVSLQRKEVA